MWSLKFDDLHGIEVSPDIVELAAHHAPKAPWHVIFIDSALGEERVACAKLFLDLHCCIVIHDSQEPYWEDLLKTVKFQRHFDFMSPRTSFISNVLDVTKE